MNLGVAVSNISIILITTETYEVQYFIEVPSTNYYRNGIIPASNEVILNLPDVEVSYYDDQDKGIYIATNSDKVNVIGFHDSDGGNIVSDSFYALPVIKLNDSYVHYGISVPRATVHSALLESSILIIGTEDNTVLKLVVTQSVNIAMNNTAIYLVPGKQYLFVVNRLQSIFIGSLDDLSGTKIVTDKPVSVFSGHECGNVPFDVRYCNHLIEQIPPTALWGKVYYTAPLVNKTSYSVKILAAYASTVVNIYCNNTIDSHRIDEGEFVNITLSTNEYCAIHSNKEVLVIQFSHGGEEDNNFGNPMMTLVPSTNQYLNVFDFSTIRDPLHTVFNYNHYVNIIVMRQYYQPSMIYLIAGGLNRSLVAERWVPIQVNSIIEAYAAQVTIPEGMAKIFHANPAAQMMTIVYGFTAYYGSYGYVGGIRLSKGC